MTKDSKNFNIKSKTNNQASPSLLSENKENEKQESSSKFDSGYAAYSERISADLSSKEPQPKNALKIL